MVYKFNFVKLLSKKVLTLSLLTVMSESACLQWCHQDHLWSLLPCEVRPVGLLDVHYLWVMLNSPCTCCSSRSSDPGPDIGVVEESQKGRWYYLLLFVLGFWAFVFSLLSMKTFLGLYSCSAYPLWQLWAHSVYQYMLTGEWSVTQSVLRVSGEEIFL